MMEKIRRKRSGCKLYIVQAVAEYSVLHRLIALYIYKH